MNKEISIINKDEEISPVNKYLNHLKNNELVYFIYQTDYSIYNIPTNNQKYLVVVNSNYLIPKEFKSSKINDSSRKKFTYKVRYEGSEFVLWSTKEWFDKILSCDIEPWECACLSRKYVIKEFVKVLMTVDLPKIKKNINYYLNSCINTVEYRFQKEKWNSVRDILFKAIKMVKFGNQIIENHKIINFKEVSNDYNVLFNTPNDKNIIINTYKYLLQDHLSRFRKYTSNILTT